MEFKKYNSITNAYETVFLNKIRELEYKGEWFVSEKIHGANCQIAYDKDGFKIGCRNSFIDDKIWMEVLGKYENNIKKLYENLNPEKIIIYGEFFGGTYPHEDVPRSKHARRVQKGVYYTPENEVLFYDMFIKMESFNGHYVSVSSFTSMMDLFDIPRVEFIPFKSLDEALAYPNNEPSQVFKRYGLPEIKDNIREGVVIKPEIELFVGQSRAIIKNKNDRFKEVSHAKKRPVSTKELDEKLAVVLDKLSLYVTTNRAENILSHFGTDLSFKVMGEFIKEMNIDVVSEFEKENNDFNMLEKAEIKEITHRLNKQVSDICKETLINKLKEM